MARSARKTSGIILAIASTTWLFAVALIFGHERATLLADQYGWSTNTAPADPILKFAVPGIVRPPTVEADAATIPPDAEVIGVVVGGRARAYRLDAFRDRSKHLVNDLIGDIPVSVAFCNINNCSSAYEGRGGNGPLEVAVGGLYKGREMILEVEGVLYFQESGLPLVAGPGLIPLDRLTTTRTTWGDWKRLHPSTDVYEGVR